MELDRTALLRRLGLGAAALSVPAAAAAPALGGDEDGGGNFPAHPKWKFVFVSHATTSPFFVATQYGIQDACALVKCTYEWKGSPKGDVEEMLRALDEAIAGKADGIAVSVIDKVAFEAPIVRALRAGIPVVSYHVDGARGGKKARLAHVGQDPYVSGFEMGRRIAELVPRGEVAVFVPGPASLDLRSRVDGAVAAVKQSGRPVDPVEVPVGSTLPEQVAKIDSWFAGRKKLKGLFAVEAGSTQVIAEVSKKHGLQAKGVRSGGFDVLLRTLQLIDEGHLNFTIDQQPYLQGFVPVLQLFLYKLSGGLVAPSDTNTGLLFVTRETVKPYLLTRTRFEGSSSRQQVVTY